MNYLKIRRSFTVMELLIVVIIIGIIAGFGIPSYQKSMDKVIERKAILSIQAMRAGMKIYKAKHSTYPNFDMETLNEINQELGLNVIADTMTYSCWVMDGGVDPNACKAVSPAGWIIHWHGEEVIHCSSATPCPSCLGRLAGGCG